MSKHYTIVAMAHSRADPNMPDGYRHSVLATMSLNCPYKNKRHRTTRLNGTARTTISINVSSSQESHQ